MFIQLSAIRSPPIYGKLDFLLLDNKPWWPDWEIIINDSIKNKNILSLIL